MSESNAYRIHSLIQANLYSAKAYFAAAEIVTDRQQEAQLRAWARERTHQADRLRAALVELGVIDQSLGRWLRKISEASSQVQAGAASHDVHQLCSGALAGETYLEKMYERLLSNPDFQPLHDELKQQYAQVRAVCFHVRRLCN